MGIAHWDDVERHRRTPHCHSEEEEIFVILEGDGTLELWPSPVSGASGAEREDIAICPGHVIARPPGTRVGHAFQAGPNGLTMLIYGTRRPNDMAWFPRSKQDLLAWARRDRAHRVARVRRRRARRLAASV
jgi:uncharacterized cupin superfamily protein